MMAGRIGTSELLSVALSFPVNDASCNTGLVELLKGTICPGADLTLRPSPDAAALCDAVSFAVNFTAVQMKPLFEDGGFPPLAPCSTGTYDASCP
jgi:hypothetical protein